MVNDVIDLTCNTVFDRTHTSKSNDCADNDSAIVQCITQGLCLNKVKRMSTSN